VDLHAEAGDEEEALGIEYGPVERAHVETLHRAGAALQFLGAWERGLEVIPKSPAPNAPPPQCDYCDAICWTQADGNPDMGARPLCQSCWDYFAAFFTGKDTGPDRCYRTPTRSSWIKHEKQGGPGVCWRCHAEGDRVCGLCAVCQQVKAAFQAAHADVHPLTLAELFSDWIEENGMISGTKEPGTCS